MDSLEEALSTDKDKEKGFVDKAIVKVVDNIRINIK